ncbi:MAG: 3-deoxy-7-phosphoheptulonate synthase [Longimicrobiales bacterium]
MLVVMQSDATQAQIDTVCRVIAEMGYKAVPMPGGQRTAIGLVGNDGRVDDSPVVALPGVAQVLHVSKPFKQVSREWKPETTQVTLAPGVVIGANDVVVIAGPCSVETEQQIVTAARAVRAAGATALRGGAFKPRSSPYSFQGLGEEGLRIMAEVRERFGMKIVTEAVDSESLDLVEEYADVIQIGARNMQNFSLLKRAGRSKKPVLLKRGMAATLEEFLMAAEYVMSEGNYNVILCERGIRTFADHTRNTLDLSVVPAVERLSHLPIVVDPSHGTGRRNKVTPMARASVAVGADGLLVEVHPNPDRALSDGMQSLYPDQFDQLMSEIRQIAAVVHRSVPAAADATQPAATR